MPLPTARSPPDSTDVGTDVAVGVVHLASDEGASLHLERVFDDNRRRGVERQRMSVTTMTSSRASNTAPCHTRSVLRGTARSPELNCKCIEGRAW